MSSATAFKRFVKKKSMEEIHGQLPGLKKPKWVDFNFNGTRLVGLVFITSYLTRARGVFVNYTH